MQMQAKRAEASDLTILALRHKHIKAAGELFKAVAKKGGD